MIRLLAGSGRRLGLVLLLLAVPAPARAQESRLWDDVAVWADFIYTLRSWDTVVWTVTPSIRTDEQELNTGFMTRVTTEATVVLPNWWDLRGKFFLIGRESELGDVFVDERIQVLARRTLYRNETLRFRGGLMYERHFRGDRVPDFNVYRGRLELRGDAIKNEPWAQQDFFFDHDRGFFRTRSRVGFLWNLRRARQIRLAYQFQYTKDRGGQWGPQHAIVFRFWFGEQLSWRAVN